MNIEYRESLHPEAFQAFFHIPHDRVEAMVDSRELLPDLGRHKATVRQIRTLAQGTSDYALTLRVTVEGSSVDQPAPVIDRSVNGRHSELFIDGKQPSAPIVGAGNILGFRNGHKRRPDTDC
jgi:hypothetical protein